MTSKQFGLTLNLIAIAISLPILLYNVNNIFVQPYFQCRSAQQEYAVLHDEYNAVMDKYEKTGNEGLWEYAGILSDRAMTQRAITMGACPEEQWAEIFK
jgi:hypothetical protein